MGKAPVFIASDHAGVDTKALVRRHLEARGFVVEDLGPDSTASIDYPGQAHRLAQQVVATAGSWGVLICGTGIGMSIAANKVAGARAALVHEPFTARMAREHNDANIIVLGARVTGSELLLASLDTFAATPFTPGDDGRHARRVAAIERSP